MRLGKALEATDKGIRLIELVHPQVKSPALTGQWESQLRRIQRGEADLAGFLRGIEDFVKEVVGDVFKNGVAPGRAPMGSSSVPWRGTELASRVSTPTPPDQLATLLPAFRLASFRPYQEAVCRAVTDGKDALVVMPTGAGKSLCYQLPGLARAGTTLVISPLIALMEDQVAKLRELGLRAERIHSGRDRSASRQACVDYLAGNLDFLYIAPERLAVPGFPEMLAKRKPALVAVDEAHCISHWGHDFRPEYRMLGQRLPMLRPAPVIGLTATATPMVQTDIARQLGLDASSRFIHGFRRTNIAVEVAEVPPSARPDAVLRVLSEPGRRPAIVYAPKRKDADALGDRLSAHFPCAAYHAGMTGAARDKVQSAFLAGRLEVIVATIAFGMGVDKPDVRTVIHTGLPGSLEGYYQEIGRAGRDGKPSRALLLHSYVDRRNHEFFHQRDYPDPNLLESIFKALGETPQPLAKLRGTLSERLKVDEETFDRAMEKLWIHGGARIGSDEDAARGETGWRPSYLGQREHKLGQLDQMARFAEAHGCRMLHLVRHFGDREDSGELCGTCDVCAPQECDVRRFRGPSRDEEDVLRRVLELLRRRNGASTGQLFRDISEEGIPGGFDRKAFERLLGGLHRAGLVRIADESFEKDGKQIPFRRATLTAEGYRGGLEAAAEVRLTDEEPPAARVRGKKKEKPPAASSASVRKPSPLKPAGIAGPAGITEPIGGDEPLPGLVDALKTWRRTEAKRRGVPAFRILTDRTLVALAAARPGDEEGLLAVPGIGPGIASKYGQEILSLLREG